MFDPSDYQDVPVVPKRKIAKNIERGRFRKGQKISIEEKLRRFADSIKPPPKITKDKGLYNKLLYFRPPKHMASLKVEPKKESEESMLKLLEEKEMEYNILGNIEILDIEEEEGVQRDSRMRRRRRSSAAGETLYDPSSIEFL